MKGPVTAEKEWLPEDWRGEIGELTGKKWRFRMTPARVVLLALGAISVLITVYRLFAGHEAVSNLNDHWPWGLWIGFNVLAGVALAGGGYSTALLANVLHVRKFSVVARSALLVSLLSYLFVMFSLFLDIGKWYNFWRPFVFWGYHSVLFEVFWCISLYLVVQLLEFGEIATERVLTGWHALFKKAMPVLLIAGVMLPTLHQQSLGGLYIIAVGKLYPLWWSMLIPVFFLISSFFVGPAMVTLVSTLAGRAYRWTVPTEVLQKLIRVSGVLMLVYLGLLVYDLSSRGVWGLVFKGNLEGNMFILEVLWMLIIPLVICWTPALFNQRKWLVVFGALVGSGVVLNRMNVVFTGMAGYLGGHYFPSLMEWALTIGFIAITALVYMFVAENFRIHAREEEIAPEVAEVEKGVVA
ncbi:MAG: NrfD/PsrC family molybdoenzyme membrane anchor subunit [Bacillota bacterium]